MIIYSELKNRAAYYEYFIEDKYDAGMVLWDRSKIHPEGKVNFVDSSASSTRVSYG